MKRPRGKHQILKFAEELGRREVHVINKEQVDNIKTITFSFPKKWNRYMQKHWLQAMDLPTEDQYFNTGWDYDCTGSIYKRLVDYKKNHVTITNYYDI